MLTWTKTVVGYTANEAECTIQRTGYAHRGDWEVLVGRRSVGTRKNLARAKRLANQMMGEK